jgi:hypothetical protein
VGAETTTAPPAPTGDAAAGPVIANVNSAVVAAIASTERMRATCTL